MSSRDVVLSVEDVQGVQTLLSLRQRSDFPGYKALRIELDLATAVAPAHVPPDVVTMNSRLALQEEASGREFLANLVYPQSVDGNPDKISVLAPIGGALLGARVGQRIKWQRAGGGFVAVRITEILYQPERDDVHRREHEI